MKPFIKANLVLIAGIVLPVVLVIGFLIVAHAPKVMVPPPTYDFLFAGYREGYPYPAPYVITYEIKHGTLRATVSPRGEKNAHRSQYGELYRYDVETGTVEEVEIDLPARLDDIEDPSRFPVEETRGWEFSKSRKSPDGYEFEYLPYRGRGGILGELFGMRRHYNSRYVLSKSGAHHEVPEPRRHRYYYNRFVFLGWILNDGSDDGAADERSSK